MSTYPLTLHTHLINNSPHHHINTTLTTHQHIITTSTLHITSTPPQQHITKSSPKHHQIITTSTTHFFKVLHGPSHMVPLKLIPQWIWIGLGVSNKMEAPSFDFFFEW